SRPCSAARSKTARSASPPARRWRTCGIWRSKAGRCARSGTGSVGTARLDQVATGSYNWGMKHVSIKEAKDHLPALVRAAEQGERVVITRNGKPVAEVIRHQKTGGIDFE